MESNVYNSFVSNETLAGNVTSLMIVLTSNVSVPLAVFVNSTGKSLFLPIPVPLLSFATTCIIKSLLLVDGSNSTISVSIVAETVPPVIVTDSPPASLYPPPPLLTFSSVMAPFSSTEIISTVKLVPVPPVVAMLVPTEYPLPPDRVALSNVRTCPAGSVEEIPPKSAPSIAN